MLSNGAPFQGEGGGAEPQWLSRSASLLGGLGPASGLYHQPAMESLRAPDRNTVRSVEKGFDAPRDG